MQKTYLNLRITKEGELKIKIKSIFVRENCEDMLKTFEKSLILGMGNQLNHAEYFLRI